MVEFDGPMARSFDKPSRHHNNGLSSALGWADFDLIPTGKTNPESNSSTPPSICSRPHTESADDCQK